jgi:hypothetical protein
VRGREGHDPAAQRVAGPKTSVTGARRLIAGAARLDAHARASGRRATSAPVDRACQNTVSRGMQGGRAVAVGDMVEPGPP